MTGTDLRVGIDVGGTKTFGVVIAEDLEVLQSARRHTGLGACAVVDTVAAVVDDLRRKTGAPLAHFSSVGVGVPGVVEANSGVVRNAVNLDVRDLDLGAALCERLGVPVAVENDVNAAAVGAYHQQPARGSLAYLNAGTGLAAGLVFDGTLQRGSHGLAGEIGHLPCIGADEACSCGQRGCLETAASGSGIQRRWATPRGLPVASLLDAAEAGEPDAVRVRQDLWCGLASAVRLLVLTTGVDRVVLGGGLTSWGPRLLDGVAVVLDQWSASSPLLASAELSQRISLVNDHGTVAAVGAALISDGQG